jgi:hypothetical protein
MNCGCCGKMAWYNFKCVDCVARFILSIPERFHRQWLRFFERTCSQQFAQAVETKMGVAGRSSVHSAHRAPLRAQR